ncbi:Ig-like domain-containing protein [Pseudomonas hamedanensis]|nr:Ig-like domain-containing protein [Pseudomonas hamedanensis]
MPAGSISLFPPYDDENQPLALRPILIAGMQAPVEDGDGGINFKTATDYPDGLLCAINPYLSPMKEGDKLEIHYNGGKILERWVAADEVDQRVFFYLPAPEQSGWIEDCHYVLTRAGETVSDPPSASLRLLVKLYKPGNFDRTPHLPGHSELHIVQLPAELVEQGVIDAEWAKNGVLATIPFYVYITRNDQIRLQLGSYSLPAHVVTQAQAEHKEPIEIYINQDAILGAGDGEEVEIRWRVSDEVWNWADTHSQTTCIDVDAGGWRLEAPIIKEAFNKVITIRDLDKKPVTVQIHVRGDEFDLGDTLTMTWLGKPPNNGKPISLSETRIIDNIPSVLEIPVPYEEVRAIAQGTADASYILYKKDGGDPLSSKRALADVVGDVDMLPEPILLQLLGDTLDPDEPYATVEVRYAMKNGDLINLVWLGKKSNDQPYLHEQPHTVSENDARQGWVRLYVNAEHISVLVNGTLDLSYRVANDDTGLYNVRESERLLVRVEKVRATLPKPVVEEAEPPGDVLDPSKVFDNVHVLIAEANTVRGDVLTYYWRSPNPFGSTGDWLPITTVSEGEPVRFRVDKEYVTANIGQYVKVSYSLSRASTGRHEYSATLDLLIGELVGDLPPPEVIQAPDGTLDPMSGLNGVDVKVSYRSMKPDQDVIRLKWLGSPGPGTSEDLELPGHSSGTVVFHLPSTLAGANIDRRVSVEYEVTRYTITTPSQTLDLYVSGFSDPESQLPRPVVPQAPSGVLDLMTFSADARALVEKWLHIAPKQIIWLQLVGETTAGDCYVIKIIDGKEITAAQLSSGLNETLLRSELVKLGHSTAATVICKVAFDGRIDENSAYVFPLLPLTVRTRYDYIQPTISKVTDSRSEIDEGGTTRDNELTIFGTATRDETVELFDGETTSLGTAAVDTDSTWNCKIGILTEKTYSITAKALYDADPVSSPPRTFTVKFAETPEVLAITDSRGPVAPGAITYDNSVFVAGSATPNLQVRLLGADAPAITLDVDERGTWSHRLNNLTVKTYSLTAEALYDIDPPVGSPRTFVVAQAVTPTISRVSDIRSDVPMNGTTYYRTVTLTGKASPNEKITLLDVDKPITTSDVKPSGDWDYVFNNLTLKTYSLIARAEYGSNPESAPPRVFTVAAFISPTITAAVDSVGPVAQGGTTYDSTVTLSGEATPRERIQLHNKGTPIGAPIDVAADKKWRAPLTSLATSSHSITAKALYGAVPVDSEPRNFTVAAHIAPKLTSVHDGISEVQPGGETKRTSVTLQGTVTPNRQVQIYDNNTPKHTVTAVGSNWSTTLPVAIGQHAIRARAVSTGQETEVRSFRVISPIPPLVFNTTKVLLNGKTYLMPEHPSVLPPFGPGTSTHHRASGGNPNSNYRYYSSNERVAVVDGTGLVTVRGKGRTQITVTDGTTTAPGYEVEVTGVIHCIGLGNGDYYTITNRAYARGTYLTTLAQLREIFNLYGSRWPMGNGYYWSTNVAANFPFLRLYMKNLVTGQEAHVQHYASYPLGIGVI